MDARNSSKERSGFWEAYRACVEENRVRLDRSPFYVNEDSGDVVQFFHLFFLSET
jgi:hypothetical protein